MTQTQRDAAESWWIRSKEIVGFSGGLILILATIVGLIQWSSGGLQLQSQVDLKQVHMQLNSIQIEQTAQASAAQAAQDRIIARLDALPRPSDYQAQDAHLSRLDGLVSDLSSRLSKVEGSLAPVPYRSPQH